MVNECNAQFGHIVLRVARPIFPDYCAKCLIFPPIFARGLFTKKGPFYNKGPTLGLFLSPLPTGVAMKPEITYHLKPNQHFLRQFPEQGHSADFFLPLSFSILQAIFLPLRSKRAKLNARANIDLAPRA